MTSSITKLPAIGSRWQWHNRKSQQVYTVIDVLVDQRSLEVRYRSDAMAEDEYCQRSVESFFSTTKEGQPRFKPLSMNPTPNQ